MGGADVSYLRAPRLRSAASGVSVSVRKRPKSESSSSRDVTFRFQPGVKKWRIASWFPACLEENSPSTVISDTNLTAGGRGEMGWTFPPQP